jgi:hypothetical protein
MRAREFILERTLGQLSADQASALPGAFVLPELANQDAYLQYRMGVALAAVRGAKSRAEDGFDDFNSVTAWGENQVIIGYSQDENLDQLLNDALKLMGKSKKIMTSTITSRETADIYTRSPISNWMK